MNNDKMIMEIERLLKVEKNQKNTGVMITSHRYALQDFQEFGFKIIDKGCSVPSKEFKLIRSISVYGDEGQELIDISYYLERNKEAVDQYKSESITKSGFTPIHEKELVNYFDINTTRIIYNSREKDNGKIVVETFNH